MDLWKFILQTLATFCRGKSHLGYSSPCWLRKKLLPLCKWRGVKPTVLFFPDTDLISFFLPDMNQQLLIMEMFLITLISRVVYRKRYDDLELPEFTDQETRHNKQNTKTNLNGKVIEDGTPNV